MVAIDETHPDLNLGDHQNRMVVMTIYQERICELCLKFSLVIMYSGCPYILSYA